MTECNVCKKTDPENLVPCFLNSNETDEPNFCLCIEHARANNFCTKCGRLNFNLSESGLCAQCEFDNPNQYDLFKYEFTEKDVLV